MLWARFIILFILFLLGRHLGFPSSPRYLELADSADFFIARENWNRAEEKIVEALRLEPANFTNSLLLANLGLVQSNKGEYHKALQTLSLGLNMAPSSTVLLNNRAHVFLMLDSVVRAAQDIDKSLQIDSLQEWSLQTRAYLYLDSGVASKAREIFLKLKDSFPDNTSIYSGLAALAEHESHFQEAGQYYRKAIEINPDDIEARIAYISLLIKIEAYQDARAQIKEGLNKDPEEAMFYLLRGYLHKINYRNDEAQADKKIAIAKGLEPEYVKNFIP